MTGPTLTLPRRGIAALVAVVVVVAAAAVVVVLARDGGGDCRVATALAAETDSFPSRSEIR